MVNENVYQRKLKKRIENMFEGSFVVKNDSSFIQGIPDLTVFYKNKYAILEVKRSANEPHRPNQDYYVDMFNGVSYAAFIYPENEKQIIKEMEEFFNEI